MKKFVHAIAIGLSLSSGSALAADLPFVKGPPVPPPCEGCPPGCPPAEPPCPCEQGAPQCFVCLPPGDAECIILVPSDRMNLWETVRIGAHKAVQAMQEKEVTVGGKTYRAGSLLAAVLAGNSASARMCLPGCCGKAGCPMRAHKRPMPMKCPTSTAPATNSSKSATTRPGGSPAAISPGVSRWMSTPVGGIGTPGFNTR